MDRRDQTHAVAGSSCLDDRRFPLLAPGPAGVVIRADMRCVAEIDFSFLPLRQDLDLRVLFLQPLLDKRLVALQGAMQRLLAGDAELGQKPPHRDKAQGDLEFILDQFGDHLAGPQRESELHLQWVLLRHGVKDPLQRPPIQFRRTPEQRLRLQGAPTAAPVLRQPSVNRRSVQPKNAGDGFWAFALLHLPHRAFAQRFQRLMIQPARIIFPHTRSESFNNDIVNKKLIYL